MEKIEKKLLPKSRISLLAWMESTMEVFYFFVTRSFIFVVATIPFAIPANLEQNR